MAPNQETALSDAAVDEFLASEETGVLALANGDDPYAIPISYGYDPDERTIFLRLVSTPESEKRRFLDSTPTARIVVYDETGDAYRSVVATGQLEAVKPASLTPESIAQYGRTKRPLFEIWAADKRDLDIELYQLVPDTLSGRLVTVDAGEETDTDE